MKPGSPNKPGDAVTNDRGIRKSALLGALMFSLMVGGIAYVIIRGEVLQERYGRPNLLAHANLCEEFVVATVFLLAPFVGACSAFRIARSAGRRARVLGWLLLVTFSLALFQAALVYWSQYQGYVNHP